MAAPAAASAGSSAEASAASSRAIPAGTGVAELMSSRFALLARVVALLVAFLFGLHFVVAGGVGLGDALAVVLLPVWVTTLSRYRGAWLLIVCGFAIALWGWLLGGFAVADGYLLSASTRLQTVTEFAGIIAGAGVLLWARTLMSTAWIGTAFGLGMIGNGYLYGQAADNAWKYVWALPVSVFVLSLVAMTHRRRLIALAIALLAVVSLALDCRSYGAALALTLVLYIAATRRVRSPKDIPNLVVVGFVVALGGAFYYLGQSLLVAGYLGRDAQARTIEQLGVDGSLILGGRPELGVTWSLLTHRPQGYGAGAIPQSSDILAGKSGFPTGYGPIGSDYVTYLFDGRFELHSVFGDIWSAFGIPGLLFVAAVAVLMLRAIANFLSKSTGEATAMLAFVWTLWNIGFSPLFSSSAIMTLGLALAVPLRAASRARTDGDAGPGVVHVPLGVPERGRGLRL